MVYGTTLYDFSFLGGIFMNYVNKYLRNFKPYKLASHKIWRVNKKERKNILKLDWNESTQHPSPLVKERLKKLVDDGDFFNLYPATNNEKIYELLSSYTSLPKENIQYFGSSDSLHEYIAKLFISVGDPIVILWPSYDNFRLTSEVNGSHVFYYSFNDDFSFNKDGFIEFIKKTDASMVYICNPNNPTGYLHSKEFIEYLLKTFPETMFLIDEAYFEFTNDKVTCSSLVLKYENILISRTMSKAFAIANFRFGYLLASKRNIEYISTIRNPKNITTFAQEAATAVLEDIPYMEKYVEQVRSAKDYFLDEISKIDTIKAFPSEGNFLVLRFPTYDEKKMVFDYLVENNIFVRDIDQSPIVHNCLRISIGTKEQMQIVIKKLLAFYGK